MKSYILLENIELYAYHGVLPQETVVGNTYILNLKIAVDVEQASITDRLEDTVSYANVYWLIKQEMEIPSKLLEHVAGRIVRKLKSTFSQIKEVELKISKQRPPIQGQIEFASVILID